MSVEKIMTQLENLGSLSIKNILINHQVHEPLFGVRISDLKKLIKLVKNNDSLAKELYNTGIYDAMCLAGLSINPRNMTKDEIQEWLNKASCDAISEWIVAGIAAESNFALELAREWIKSKNERIVSCGWSTYSNYISITDDSMIDIDEVSDLLDFIQLNIHQERNRVKYNMNGFVISVGSYILALNSKALLVSKAIGKVDVFMGDTSCKVPLATSYIEKVVAKNKVGKKKKKCIC